MESYDSKRTREVQDFNGIQDYIGLLANDEGRFCLFPRIVKMRWSWSIPLWKSI